MTNVTYQHAKSACYSLAHSLGRNGIEQNELISKLQKVESTEGTLEVEAADRRRLITVMLDSLRESLT